MSGYAGTPTYGDRERDAAARVAAAKAAARVAAAKAAARVAAAKAAGRPNNSARAEPEAEELDDDPETPTQNAPA